MQKQYSTNQEKIQGQVFFYRPYPDKVYRKRIRPLTAVLAGILILLIVFSVVVITRAEEKTIPCWVICQPGDYINLRLEPDKHSMCVGFLECGDEFETDGVSRNGFIRVMGAGDTECWIYSGYVVTEKPETVFSNYCVVARNRVACRRWVEGPQVKTRPWLTNGTELQVFYIAEGWAVTSRGFVRAEWLEVCT